MLRYFEGLREEAADIFKSEDDWADLASLAKLVRTDSAIRESLRCNPLTARAAMRVVVQKDGVTLPEGAHVPHGSLLGVSLVGVHTDGRFYANANEYDPFRFVKSQNNAIAKNNPDAVADSKASELRKNVNLATNSDIFLSFGHGRHAW